MRKQMISSTQKDVAISEREWLPLTQLAQAEITSEEAGYPIESALLPSTSAGWCAATSGEQLIRLHFDTPQLLHHIRLRFVETEIERTQEFALRYSRDNGRTFHEIVRQQWNFSPGGSASELEEYQVNLPEVTTLELTITPDISRGNAHASLAEFGLA